MKQDLALGKRVFFFYLSSKQFLINAVTLILLQKPLTTKIIIRGAMRSRTNSDEWRVLNIEEGMPTVEEARKTLLLEIERAKRDRLRALILIHGYGSSGVGGKLKVALTRSLNLRKKEGKIKGFIKGEDWSIFNDEARNLLEEIPCLQNDPDLNQGNEGITVVLL